MTISIVDQAQLIAFWLAFSRWTAILFQLPLFEGGGVPALVKVLSSLMITYAFFPGAEATLMAEVNHMGVDHFWTLTIFHTFIGLLIGFLVKSIMSIFVASGAVMTQQIGFSSISYFDPTFVARTGPFEKLINWSIIIMVLASGGLLPMFKGVYESFHTISLMNYDKLGQTPVFYQQFFKTLFATAILLSTPILISNLLLNLVMGIVARTVPQMNILMISFVVNIGIGLIVFLAISQEFFQVAYQIYVEKLGDWFQFVT